MFVENNVHMISSASTAESLIFCVNSKPLPFPYFKITSRNCLYNSRKCDSGLKLNSFPLLRIRTEFSNVLETGNATTTTTHTPQIYDSEANPPSVELKG